MFVKKSWSIRNGKKIVNYSIVESIRVKGKKYPKHRVLANISFLPIEIIEKIKILLKNPNAAVIDDLDSFFKKSYIYGSLAFFCLFMKRLGVLESLRCLPKVSRVLMLAIVLNRILDPRSKLGSVEWIKRTAFEFLLKKDLKKLKVNQIYKSMDIFYERIDEITENFFTMNKRGTKLLLYDITSVFFEGEGPELSKLGYSRDKRGDRPQILLSLCLNEEKMPVYFDIISGNIQDKKTVVPFIDKLKEKFNLKESIFIGDRGMISAENLEKLEETDLDYIIALTHKEARRLLWDKSINQLELFDKEMPAVILKEEGKRYILCGSQYRKEYDIYVLNRLLEKGKDALEQVKRMVETGYLKDSIKIIKRAQKKLTKSGADKFYDFNYENGRFEIIENTEYIQMSKNLCGFYILKTTEVEMSEIEIEENYKRLMLVERTFRELKDLVEIRPIFHWKDRRVKTHIFLCILAQVLVSKTIETLKNTGWLEKRKEHSFKSFLDILSEIKLGIFEIDDATKKIITNLDENQKKILNLFNMDLKYFKNPIKTIVV